MQVFHKILCFQKMYTFFNVKQNVKIYINRIYRKLTNENYKTTGYTK